MATNLYEYYQSKGQALPSVQDRTGVATQAGITGYKGTAQQNTQLLNYLQGQSTAPQAPTGSGLPIDTASKTSTAIVPPPVAPANNGNIQPMVDTVVASQEQQNVDKLAADKNKTQTDIVKGLIDQGTISSSVDRSAQDAAQKQVDFYTKQLEQEQAANKTRIENFQKNAGGMEAPALQAETERINRESLSHQANISLALSGVTRDLATASAIADREVEMKMEASKANLNALNFIYETQSQEWSTAEKRMWEQATKKEDAKIKKQEDLENTIKEIKLSAISGDISLATLDQLSKIDTSKPDALDQVIKIALENGIEIAGTTSGEKRILGNASTGYYTYNMKTGKTEPIKSPTGGNTTVTENLKSATKSVNETLKTGVAPSGEKIGNGMGGDGYTDPYVYVEAFQNWIGTTKQFLAAFPVKQYVNPASYSLLPASIKPEVKGTTSTTDTNNEENIF